MTVNPRGVILEPTTQAFLTKMAALPRLDTVDPAEGRRIIDHWQHKPGSIAVLERRLVVDSAAGPVQIRIVMPPNTHGRVPVLLYVHGGGWVFGGARSHGRLVRELAVQTGAAVVFPEYGLSPESRYPVALMQICGVAQWVLSDGPRHGLECIADRRGR
jgi:acetyl esterase/lipase